MSAYLTLTPRDPLIARDGRPFGIGQGHRMRALTWFLPSVLAGALRTLLGKSTSEEFSEATVHALKQMTVVGPFLQLKNELYFPAPADLVVWKDDTADNPALRRQAMPLRPFMDGSSDTECDLPGRLVPVHITQDVKPERAPEFWSATAMYRWLCNTEEKMISAPPTPEDATPESGYLASLSQDKRTHVRIDAQSGASEDSLLFMTVGLDFSRKGPETSLSIAARVDSDQTFGEYLAQLDTFHPFGGERRLLHWGQGNAAAWAPPQEVRRTMQGKQNIRLILATPAVFTHGWKPGWLDDELRGSPPGTTVTVRLVSACINRWKPLSGWSLEKNQVGPKPLRRMVPAGSTFFFIVESGDATELFDQLWLHSVCDVEQDRRDGFGLALWGVWAPSA